MILAAITWSSVNWQTVFAGIAVIGTVIYNFAKQRSDRRALDESQLHNNINELTTIYKELVDDLREEVNRLREENKALTEIVQTLTLKVEEFERADRRIELLNKDLTRQVAVLEADAKNYAKNKRLRDKRDEIAEARDERADLRDTTGGVRDNRADVRDDRADIRDNRADLRDDLIKGD